MYWTSGYKDRSQLYALGNQQEVAGFLKLPPFPPTPDSHSWRQVIAHICGGIEAAAQATFPGIPKRPILGAHCPFRKHCLIRRQGRTPESHWSILPPQAARRAFTTHPAPHPELCPPSLAEQRHVQETSTPVVHSGEQTAPLASLLSSGNLPNFVR